MTHPVNSNSFIVKNRRYPHKSPPRGKRRKQMMGQSPFGDDWSFNSLKCREKERNNKHYIFI